MIQRYSVSQVKRYVRWHWNVSARLNLINFSLILQRFKDRQRLALCLSSFKFTAIQHNLQRGLHDIENQMIFKSNRNFIFHDSRGFESGSVDEMELVRAFIAKHAQSTELRKQLHAIWCESLLDVTLWRDSEYWILVRYCLPTDTDRLLLEADKKFFNEYGSGNGMCKFLGSININAKSGLQVPVVAIFTKFDGLLTTAFSELRKEGLSIGRANNNKVDRANKKLNTNFVGPLMATKFRPSTHVQLAGRCIGMV